VASRDRQPVKTGFDGKGGSLPEEMLPQTIAYGGVSFRLAFPETANAMTARGQAISLPAPARRVYLLAAATDGDERAVFKIGQTETALMIQNWGGLIGQWDKRNWKQTEVQVPSRTAPPGTPPDIAAQMQRPRTRINPYGEMTGITPGFIRRTPVAWFASHHHNQSGMNEAYAYSYLFAYAIEVPPGAKTLTLPVNEHVRILAISTSNERTRLQPAQPLYDMLQR
jgi:alpha-mannosidase